MKHPVWSMELLRDTNAPMDRIVSALKLGQAYGTWHPRLREVVPKVWVDEVERFEMGYLLRPVWGVEEQGRFEIQVDGPRVRLRHGATFKGWPVLLLMGWWRMRSHRLWERFVGHLDVPS